MELAASAVAKVNMQRDERGITYARKAMIKCGLSKDLNGIWHEARLFDHLQEIIDRHRDYFDGTMP